MSLQRAAALRPPAKWETGKFVHPIGSGTPDRPGLGGRDISAYDQPTAQYDRVSASPARHQDSEEPVVGFVVRYLAITFGTTRESC